MKPRAYVETSMISYLTALASKDLGLLQIRSILALREGHCERRSLHWTRIDLESPSGKTDSLLVVAEFPSDLGKAADTRCALRQDRQDVLKAASRFVVAFSFQSRESFVEDWLHLQEAGPPPAQEQRKAAPE